MEFVSILDRTEVPVKDAPRGEFFTDFNLSQIISEISHLWGEDILPFYRYFPKTASDEKYRRDVYDDIVNPDIYEGVYKAYSLMQKKKYAEVNKSKARQGVSIEVWHVNEIYWYTRGVYCLNEELKDKDLKSEGMLAFRDKLTEYAGTAEFKKLYEVSEIIQTGLDGLRIRMVYENGRMILEENYENHPGALTEKTLRSFYEENKNRLENPFSGELDILGIEKDILFLVMRKHPEIYKEAGKIYKEYFDYEEEFLSRFFKEISFYLSYAVFEKEMNKAGYEMTSPEVDESKNISAQGLYDLALAVANNKRGLEVVSNDFHYNEDELFFVLTGPNQGGKTTFARSLGQLVFFTKMGLHVPASHANLHYFSDILTHFSVEESVETGRGKLMEELVRLSPMMKTARENAFIVINELFTTAANYDAVIMGKKVLEHFISNGCHGIYVTHLSELLESEDKAVGLCAALNEEGIQTYKILREVMEYEACATNQINKYKLSYDDIKKRLQERREN